MGLSLDYTCLMSGGPQGSAGVESEWLSAAAAAHAGHLSALQQKRSSGQLGFFDLPDDRETVSAVSDWAETQKGRWDNLVIMGIGGSALGTSALHAALSPTFHELAPQEGRPRLFVVDNVDPALVAGVLSVCKPERTLFNVISKSGSTAETMSQFLLFFDRLRAAVGEQWTDHVVVTTDAEQGFLRPFARTHGLTAFTVPANVGGRFSVLTPVGLVPGALLGWDLTALMDGAAAGRERCLSADFAANPAALIAATHHLLDTRCGMGIQVLFPYSHRLRLLGDWLVQLNAESLGKLDASGTGVGPLPHVAIGATDQHSQVQLFVEGPNNKVFTFLRVAEHDDITIPAPPEGLDGLAYLGGQGFGTLLDAECRATRFALTSAGRPNAEITFPRIDAYHVGEWIMWMQIAVAFGGELYGVDAFDQPGVEGGKVATYGLMGREGFEDDRARVEAAAMSDERYVV
jgi:glucose-6-phosphate isomerase